MNQNTTIKYCRKHANRICALSKGEGCLAQHGTGDYCELQIDDRYISLDNSEDEVYRRAIDQWGEDGAIRAYHEEVGELMTAMSHFVRGRIPIEGVIEEIVDVKIAIGMMRILFDKSPYFNIYSDIYQQKFRKLENAVK